jgi:hypothetical protein
MGQRTVHAEGLLEVCGRLGDAVVNPPIWPKLMAEISPAAGATGAMLLRSDAHAPDIPSAQSFAEGLDDYFDMGPHVGGIRAARGVNLCVFI